MKTFLAGAVWKEVLASQNGPGTFQDDGKLPKSFLFFLLKVSCITKARPAAPCPAAPCPRGTGVTGKRGGISWILC